MIPRIVIALSAGAAIMLTSGCGGTRVQRIDAATQTDLSGKWNDTDSRLVAEEMIKDCLSRPWIDKFSGASKTPTIIVGEIRNKSHEHIAVETFGKDIERELINSGRVEFVANKNERIALREEKADQMAGNTTQETVKEAGNEAGADLMLLGSVTTIADQEGNKAVMFYQINLQLTEILTNKTLWIGDKKIKKYITRSKASL